MRTAGDFLGELWEHNRLRSKGSSHICGNATRQMSRQRCCHGMHGMPDSSINMDLILKLSELNVGNTESGDKRS